MTIEPAERRLWWTSDDPAEREAALNHCRVCAVRIVCYAYALALPGTPGDIAIYGGMSVAERRRRRKEAQFGIHREPYAYLSDTQRAT